MYYLTLKITRLHISPRYS